MRDSFACTIIGCGYWTKTKEGTTAKELDKIVKQDGGFMKGKETCCPKCKKDSLVYLY